MVNQAQAEGHLSAAPGRAPLIKRTIGSPCPKAHSIAAMPPTPAIGPRLGAGLRGRGVAPVAPLRLACDNRPIFSQERYLRPVCPAAGAISPGRAECDSLATMTPILMGRRKPTSHRVAGQNGRAFRCAVTPRGGGDRRANAPRTRRTTVFMALRQHARSGPFVRRYKPRPGCLPAAICVR